MLRPSPAWLLVAALAGAAAGASGAPAVVFSTVADQSTTIPGSNVPFVKVSGFVCCGDYTAPAVSAGNVAFWASGSTEVPAVQQGIYALRYGVLEKIADVNTPVPFGGGFRVFVGDPSISGGNVAFAAFDQSFRPGIYGAGPWPVWSAGPIRIDDSALSGDPGLEPDVSGQNFSYGVTALYAAIITDPQPGPFSLPIRAPIADTGTPVPNGTGNFNGFGNTAIGGATVTFGARSADREGIYARRAGGPLVAVVDTQTPIPGGGGNFEGFSDIAFDAANIAFRGFGSGSRIGVYTVALPPDLSGIAQPLKVADTATVVPGSDVTFDRFGFISIDRGYVVFEGSSIQNGTRVHGLYTNATGTLTKVVDDTDIIVGKRLEFATFGRRGFSGNQVVFAADFWDGTSAIVSARLVGDRCPLTQLAWRDRPDVWPATDLILGNKSYSKEEILALLKTPDRGDASIVLAKQLIAAKLNTLNFTRSLPAVPATAHADGTLARFPGKLPYRVLGVSKTSVAMLGDATQLGAFNAGLFEPRCLVRR